MGLLTVSSPARVRADLTTRRLAMNIIYIITYVSYNDLNSVNQVTFYNRIAANSFYNKLVNITASCILTTDSINNGHKYDLKRA
jgi:hypothetical protein